MGQKGLYKEQAFNYSRLEELVEQCGSQEENNLGTLESKPLYLSISF
jgi:hypothetical protein